MSTGTSEKMCSIEAEETTIGREEDEDGEDSPVARNLGLLLQPPRLEDAGLENCALPLESIQEAFSIAAKSLESRRTSAYYSEDDEDEGDVEGCTFGTCAKVRSPGFDDEANISSEGISDGGAIGRGGGFSEEKALGSDVIPGNGGTGTGTGGEQTEQSACSDEYFDICSRTGRS